MKRFGKICSGGGGLLSLAMMWGFFSEPAVAVNDPRFGRRLEAYDFRPGLIATVGRSRQAEPEWIHISSAAVPGSLLKPLP
jgi:hypothetical protein